MYLAPCILPQHFIYDFNTSKRHELIPSIPKQSYWKLVQWPFAHLFPSKVAKVAMLGNQKGQTRYNDSGPQWKQENNPYLRFYPRAISSLDNSTKKRPIRLEYNCCFTRSDLFLLNQLLIREVSLIVFQEIMEFLNLWDFTSPCFPL